MKTTATWINSAGQPMAIAASAEAACALWQADLKAALDAGNCTPDDFDGELPIYKVSNTNRVINDVESYANDRCAPDAQGVVDAAERGELFEYAC